MKQCIHVEIEGRVQGVGYRGWMIAQASKLALDGWVRNRRDGTVEACVQGQSDAIAKMLAMCHEGPELALVTRVRHGPSAEQVGPGFEQRPTT